MNILIRSVPHEKQRYNTIGDWKWDSLNDLQITVSSTGNRRMDTLIAVHELVEALMCEAYCITEKEVDAYDLAHENDPNLGSDCLSDCMDSPYFICHNAATVIEYQLSREMMIDWREYTRTIDELWKKRTTTKLNQTATASSVSPAESNSPQTTRSTPAKTPSSTTSSPDTSSDVD